MTTFKCYITLTLLLSTVTLSRGQTVTDPIADMIPTSAPDSADDPYFLRRVIVKCVYDFDNDGILDLAVSESPELLWGNAGGFWEVYLGQPGGGYKKLDDFFFHPSAINIQPVRPGESKVTIYHRESASYGELIEYSLSLAGIKENNSTTISVESAGSWDVDSPAKRLYDTLFYDRLHVPVVSSCRLSDLCKNPKALWRDGY